jgi:hypothetical protein
VFDEMPKRSLLFSALQKDRDGKVSIEGIIAATN